MQIITNDELKYLLQITDLILLDVREHYEYEQGHIPGALWFPLNRIGELASFWSFDTKLVVICNTENRSAAACRYLKSHGFKNLFYVVPGMKAWDGPLTTAGCPMLTRGTNSIKQVYFDHAATTPVDPQVASAMWWYLTQEFGNPSSAYYYGRRSKEALFKARHQVAQLIGANEQEIIFTSGGTEADNTALWGILKALPPERRVLITSAIEHAAILNNIPALEKAGYRVIVLPVTDTGLVEPEVLEQALSSKVGLVSIMYANNEVGTIQPIAELVKLAHQVGAYFHTDAVQAVGLCSIDVNQLQVDALSLSAHKIYGPKGVGALYLRDGTPYLPFIYGGAQENQRRAGTENVAGIVGLGVACQRICQQLKNVEYLKELRDYLEDSLKLLSGVTIHGHPTQRLPNNCCFSISDYSGQDLVLDLDVYGIACSSGSACQGKQPSHVLQAIHVPEKQIKQAIRISLGWSNTREEIDYFISVLKELTGE
ncbi:MAG: aminotransferase class V-fold PLP-dependent enzyme [Firmicutes bacterium]|nr:aminotransferase class V-fold PLP-dependent enzyme [Bacillota bacterium]